jgi:radical SAM protein with 4Fe4S-binding SPASM domain
VWEEDGFGLRITPLAEWRGRLLDGDPVRMCEYNVRDRSNVLITVSPEGFLYPCHRFQDRDIHCIGHISEMTFEQIIENRTTYEISERKENPVSECRSCGYAGLCRSGCVATHDQSGKTMWCEGLKSFFSYLNQKFPDRKVEGVRDVEAS